MCDMCEKNYALDWYRYGLEKGDDFFVKFMMHWIAFNWLYSEYYDRDESQKIEIFCEANYYKLSRYNPFDTEAFQIFLEKPIHDIVHGREYTIIYESLKKDNDLKRVKSLFCTMYHIRCNLFHGSKSFMLERDRRLVSASAEILEGYLKALLTEG